MREKSGVWPPLGIIKSDWIFDPLIITYFFALPQYHAKNCKVRVTKKFKITTPLLSRAVPPHFYF